MTTTEQSIRNRKGSIYFVLYDIHGYLTIEPIMVKRHDCNFQDTGGQVCNFLLKFSLDLLQHTNMTAISDD